MQFSFGSQENIRENMRDLLLSINHRISLIEQSLHTKVRYRLFRWIEINV